MNENYLHHVWMKKRIPSIQVSLTDERKIDILNFGFYNKSAAGPDFSMGIIHLDGSDIFGPIEMHVKSSDWYKHGHQNDPAYNNVILHVVYQHDQEVIQNGSTLPTLEIAPYIDAQHHRNFRLSNGEAELLCADLINSLYFELEQMKAEALNDRLMLKVDLFLDNNRSFSDLYYKLLAQSSGYKINKKAFDNLTDRYSLKTLMKVSREDRFHFLLQRSGLSVKNKKAGVWEMSGYLPAGHPIQRLKQFVEIINVTEPVDQLSFLLKTDYKEFCIMIKSETAKIPESFIRHIFTNAVVPLQFVHCLVHGNETASIVSKLKAIPAESNRIVKLWKSAGVNAKNAYDSQSLIALYNSLCNEKKCLSCNVGNALVKEPNDTEDRIFL